VEEMVFVIRPKDDYTSLCENVKRRYFEYLSKGVKRFKFLIVSKEPLYKWIESVRCVLEVNISATIIVKQVNPDELNKIVTSTENVIEITR